jgi:2-polyprenyl-3-methyl-5-hydroxy-6-metoxy-1,4-benzoquinol methylase
MIDQYDKLAPYYRDYVQKKTKYLLTIDRLIIQNLSGNPQSLLDVGSGDGTRGITLAKKLRIKKVYLCDPSAEMIKKCRQLKPTRAIQSGAENLAINDKFDTTLCLWNVLGHIKTRKRRIAALKNMKNCLEPGGKLFLDIQNRHNANAYGGLKTLGRLILDTFFPNDQRGNTHFIWKIKNQQFPGRGHLFTAEEIQGIIRESGLKIKKRYIVNYESGKIEKFFWQGQLLYVISNE